MYLVQTSTLLPLLVTAALLVSRVVSDLTAPANPNAPLPVVPSTGAISYSPSQAVPTHKIVIPPSTATTEIPISLSTSQGPGTQSPHPMGMAEPSSIPAPQGVPQPSDHPPTPGPLPGSSPHPPMEPSIPNAASPSNSYHHPTPSTPPPQEVTGTHHSNARTRRD